MYSLLDFKIHGDERGSLVAIESGINIPFKVKRLFYIYGTTGNTVRGLHANRNSTMIFIPVSGSCKLKISDGVSEKHFNLNNRGQGILLEKMTWKEIYDFSKDSILLVISDSYYNKDEYINDFEQFVKEKWDDSLT